MAKCRSCGAEIRWVVMSSGKRAPLDAEPAADGNVVEESDGRCVVAVGFIQPDRPRFKSHFATCKFAASHRKARRPDEEAAS